LKPKLYSEGLDHSPYHRAHFCESRSNGAFPHQWL